MAGVTTEFLGEMLELCGRIRSGEVTPSGEVWETLSTAPSRATATSRSQPHCFLMTALWSGANRRFPAELERLVALERVARIAPLTATITYALHRKGLVQKAKASGTPTRAPLGCLNGCKLIDGREVRTIEVDPEQAPHVRWAFAAYTSGAYTLDTLQASLTERGLTTRPTPSRPAKPISRSQLASPLASPYYVGTVRYAGVDYEGATSG